MAQQHGGPAFLIKATYVIDPADIEVFKAIAGRFAVEVVQRHGCAFLNATQDVLDPTVFNLIEGWENQQAFEDQLASKEFQAVLGEALALRIIHRSAARFEVSGVSELDMPS